MAAMHEPGFAMGLCYVGEIRGRPAARSRDRDRGRSQSRSVSRPPDGQGKSLGQRERYSDALVVRAAADDNDPTMKTKAGRPAMVNEIRRAIRNTTPGQGELTEWHKKHLGTYTTMTLGDNQLQKWLNTRYVRDRLLSKSDLSAPTVFGAPIRCLVEAVRILFCGRITRVYRGTRMTRTQLEVFKDAERRGGILQWNGFTSTSLSKRVARSFAGEPDAGRVPVLFEIRRGASHPTAANISKFSRYTQRDEEEVLLIPGFRFKVIEVRDDGASTHVILKEHQIKSHA